MRVEIELFRPSPSDLNYPGKLEEYFQQKAQGLQPVQEDEEEEVKEKKGW